MSTTAAPISRFFAFLAMVAVLSLATSSAHAQRGNNKLQVGSKAPSATFAGAKLISGDAPPPSFEKGKTYVVEFWATWCGPCLKSIPHLNDLSQRLRRKGVMFIGVSDENPDKVSDFVKKKGSGMSYTVISDVKKDYNKAYMSAAGQKGIPTAFIVGPTGNIVYIGHPMEDEFERVLMLCSDGKYDPELSERAQPLMDAVEVSIATRDWRQAHRQLDSIIQIDSWIFSDLMIRKYKMMLNEQGLPGEAEAYLRKQLNVYHNKPDVLEDIAFLMINDPDIENGNMEIAEQAVAQVAAIKGEKSPEVLELVATLAFHKGDLDQAIDCQFQAWMAADAGYKADLKRGLDRYKSEKAKSSRQGVRRGGRR
ncbi:MAG: TlpA family protein disulfide reductase [Phycisphaerales bacterium]|nr:TlpA family protein disulfide reductase [Phycisphaerales bacterium]